MEEEEVEEKEGEGREEKENRESRRNVRLDQLSSYIRTNNNFLMKMNYETIHPGFQVHTKNTHSEITLNKSETDRLNSSFLLTFVFHLEATHISELYVLPTDVLFTTINLHQYNNPFSSVLFSFFNSAHDQNTVMIWLLDLVPCHKFLISDTNWHKSLENAPSLTTWSRVFDTKHKYLTRSTEDGWFNPGIDTIW